MKPQAQTQPRAPFAAAERGPRGTPWAWAAIFIVTIAAYLPAIRGGFVWDDEGHVTRADLRSLHGLWRIWLEPGATQQYYPLLHSAFWLEHRLWGDHAWAYHLLNVLLHATAACLLARVLLRLLEGSRDGGRNAAAWFAAALFALHPVCVESVAWISEQKNTLSTFFFLASALAYLRYARDTPAGMRSADLPSVAPPPEARGGRVAYGGAFLLFAMALACKTTTAVLPVLLLVAIWWRKGRLDWRRDVLPLVPWIGMGAAAGAFTAWVERTAIGAHGARFDLGFMGRCLLAGRATWFYIGKLAWPFHLIFVYPRWTIDPADPGQYLPLAGLAAVAALAWIFRARGRGPLAALLAFVAALFPALGFFNVYPFVFSFVADHFQYLATLPAFAAVSLGAAWIWNCLPRPARSAGRAGLAALAAVLGALTWRQCGGYRDLETFFRAILAENPSAWMAHDNLGVVLAQTGRVPEAIGHYEAALRLDPDTPQTDNNLGNALAKEGRWAEAAAAYREALRLDPGFVEAELNWGNALSDAGGYREAEGHFRRAFSLRRQYPEAHYGLANALGNEGRLAGAIDQYGEALRLRPGYVEALANLGLALARSGRLDEAAERLGAAIRLQPDYAEAHAYLGFTRAGQGRFSEAASAYRDALRLDPRNPDVHYQLALVLRALGDDAGAQVELGAARRSTARQRPGGPSPP